MKKTITAIQYLFGLIFFIFGLNGFFHFLPQPPAPEEGMKYLSGLMAAPYFFPLLKGTEVLVGLALLANRFVSLALIVITPIVVQIFLYHTVLDPSGAAMAIVLVLFLGVLAWNKRENYSNLLNPKN